MTKTITVQTIVKSTPQKVWECMTTPSDITEWCHASDDWGVGEVENDMREGGRFKTHMMAKDGSAGFDFTGTYTRIELQKGYVYLMDGADKRMCRVIFEAVDGGVRVSETFDMEHENTEELQRAGWQAILENFKKYVESK